MKKEEERTEIFPQTHLQRDINIIAFTLSFMLGTIRVTSKQLLQTRLSFCHSYSTCQPIFNFCLLFANNCLILISR